MPDITDIDFNSADHGQAKALREALMNIFRRERALRMFLKEELGFDLHDEIEDGPFKEQVFDLIDLYRARGKLNGLMKAIAGSDDYKEAPALHDLATAWESLAIFKEKAAVRRPPGRPSTLERILDHEMPRMHPMRMISGLAALRRRVCLLRDDEGPRATGFLIGPDLIMTVGYLAAYSDVSAFSAQFDSGLGEDRGGIPAAYKTAASIVLEPRIEDEDKSTERFLRSLDYLVMPLAKKIGEERFADGTYRGWFDLTDMRERLRSDEPAFLLHHPGGGPMMLTQGQIGEPPKWSGRFSHTCITEAGSGGAPIVDATLRLIGIHEMARQALNNKRREASIAIRADWIAHDLIERGLKPIAPPMPVEA